MEVLRLSEGLIDDDPVRIIRSQPLACREEELTNGWLRDWVRLYIGGKLLLAEQDTGVPAGLFHVGAGDDAGRMRDGFDLPWRERRRIQPQVRPVQLSEQPIEGG